MRREYNKNIINNFLNIYIKVGIKAYLWRIKLNSKENDITNG